MFAVTAHGIMHESAQCFAVKCSEAHVNENGLDGHVWAGVEVDARRVINERENCFLTSEHSGSGVFVLVGTLPAHAELLVHAAAQRA